MTQTHTPGPWVIKEYDNGHTGEFGLHGIFTDSHEGPQQTPIVASIWGKTLEESDANAALVAAAPAMLAALRLAHARIAALSPPGYIAPELWDIAAAIAKAEGRS